LEIIKTQAGSIMRAEKINRNIYWRDNIIKKGDQREFPFTDDGRQLFFEMGDFADWEPLGIPKVGTYVAVVRLDEKKTKKGRLLPYEPYDEIELSRERAISLMRQGGKVRPASPDIPDLGFFCSWRYEFPKATLDRALPLEDQLAERRRQERIEAEAERAEFATAVKAGRTPSFVPGWKK
jgi:hypothetical protein